MTNLSAERPTDGEGRAYHLQTNPGDIAEYCLLVGDPERATMIAETHFHQWKLVGDHRGLKTYTGYYRGIRMSVVTTGMGGASAGIVLSEAVQCGAKAFMHVGSCGSLQARAKVGDIVVCTGAVRLDGASENWAPLEFPAVADWRMTRMLEDSVRFNRAEAHFGIGVTTSCFFEGQARPNQDGVVSESARLRHDELLRCGALFYAMEDAALFVWCLTHGSIPCGSVNAVFANRINGDLQGGAGIETAAVVALDALREFALTY